MKKRAILLVLLMILFVWWGCGTSGGDSSTRTTTTTLMSTSLATATASTSARVIRTLSSSCGSSSLTNCITPSNVNGKVYYGGIMVGNESGYSLGPIIGDVTDPSPVTSFTEDELLDFNLGEQLDVSGSIECCGGSPYPADADAIVSRIEIYFGWVDATLALAESDGVDETLVGTHQIRTVYADIDSTEYQKGDLLYKGSSDSAFMWCTAESGCTHTTRPSGAVQNSTVANYSGTDDGLGNQTIAGFAANLTSGHETITVTETQAESSNFAITADFDMENAVGWTSDITHMTSIYEMVADFSLAAEPGDSDGGFTVTVTIDLTESAGEGEGEGE